MSRCVLILAHSWPPDANVGAVRPVYLARQLARLGWKPIVVTAKEHYYESRNPGGVAGTESAIVIRTSCLPTLRKGYLAIIRLFARLGQSVPARPNSDEVAKNAGPSLAKPVPGFLRRTALSLLYTPDEFLGWFPFALFASLRAAARHRPECVISTAPPFTSHLVAMVVKVLCRIEWIADFRDPWSWREGIPDEMTSPLSNGINRRLERLVMRYATRVICVTPSTTERYRQIYSRLPDNKWITITNGYDMDEFSRLGPVEPFERFTISYVGTFDFSRTPALFLRAVGQLVAEAKIEKAKIAVRFIGPCDIAGDKSVADLIAENGLDGVAELVGFLPRPDALKETIRASALLLLGGTQSLSIAAKVYEYLAAGRPILAITKEGATADIIRGVRGGQVLAPDDLNGVKDAILWLYAEHHHHQRNRSLTQHAEPCSDPNAAYSWETLGKRYAEVLDECSGDR